MTFQKSSVVFFIFFTIAFREASAWTIDLPEVRRFLFEKNEKYKQEHKNEYEDYVVNKDQKFYSNIQGNSKHNAEEHKHHEYEKENYADGYDYHSYMEKKVHKMVRDGSVYLEGLRRSLEDYTSFLESCDRQNSTQSNSTWTATYNASSPNFPTNSSERMMLTMKDYNSSVVPYRPNDSERMTPVSRTRPRTRMTCERATEVSERVRRYADLAMWATKRLQDIAYAKKYQKTDEEEEDELILKLAWFLDRLAYLTGYEPEYKDDEPRTTGRPTTFPAVPTFMPSSEAVVQEMMDCLKRESTEPATVHCRYNMPIPDTVARILDGGTTPSPSRVARSEAVLPLFDSIPNQSSEILITTDDTSPKMFQKSPITKRSTEYTYYYQPKPLHEMTYPAPLLKIVKHRLSNIKAVVKSIVERRLAHIAEKHEEKKHFEKRSISDSNDKTSNVIELSNSKSTVKSVIKNPFEDSVLLHYPVSDVSVINTKSFKKRSVDELGMKSNDIHRLSNWKSVVKSIEKKPYTRKMFENFFVTEKKATHLSKYSDKKVKSLTKRFTNDPMSKLANYYLKYKIWESANPLLTKKNFNKKGSFDVKNHLEPKVIHKRSLFKKNVVHLHLPKPLQTIRTHIHRHHDKKPNLIAHLQKLHNLKHKKLEKLHKIHKRSIHYEDMYLPRVSMDPQGDISYYIKNKEGTNYNPSLVQAAQVRLGLQQIFQTGNIEVIHRYGSNYNPLNPAPLYTGVLLTMADS